MQLVCDLGVTILGWYLVTISQTYFSEPENQDVSLEELTRRFRFAEKEI